jgi:anti-sigma B factor antagonist
VGDHQPFSVTWHRAGPAAVVVPVGEVDLATVDTLQAELDAARSDTESIVLDLREVEFMDSAGLRLVLHNTRFPGAFAVVRGPREVQRLFDLVGLGDRVTVLETPPEG